MRPSLRSEPIPQSAAPPRPHLWTVAEYHRMAETRLLDETSRVELIEGEITDMAPIGTLHAFTLNRITQLFYRHFGNRYLIRVQDPISLGPRSEPQPDLVLALDRDYSQHHPGPEEILLVLEVADVSFKYDRHIKLPLYLRHAIPEVWVLDLEGGSLHLQRQGEEEPRVLGKGETLSLAGVNIQVAQLLP